MSPMQPRANTSVKAAPACGFCWTTRRQALPSLQRQAAMLLLLQTDGAFSLLRVSALSPDKTLMFVLPAKKSQNGLGKLTFRDNSAFAFTG